MSGREYKYIFTCQEKEERIPKRKTIKLKKQKKRDETNLIFREERRREKS